MTREDYEQAAIKAKTYLASLKKMAAIIKVSLLAAQTALEEMEAGLQSAKENFAELKRAPIVLLSEWDVVCRMVEDHNLMLKECLQHRTDRAADYASNLNKQVEATRTIEAMQQKAASWGQVVELHHDSRRNST
jgi:hypothetical protein